MHKKIIMMTIFFSILVLIYFSITFVLYLSQRNLLYYPSENNYSEDKLIVTINKVIIKT